MKITKRFPRALLLASALSGCGLLAPQAGLAQSAPATVLASVPTPKSVLGHDPGDDYYLANYEEEISYFKALAKASDRIKLLTSGKTTQGRTYTYAVISSPENIAMFDKQKELSKRLGAAKGLTDEDARQLAKDGKIIVHIDGGMHASEVSDHQLPMALAYKLVSAKDDAEVDAILKNVILVLWPTLNPDGQDMVVDWYRKQRGTPWEGSKTPQLYQEYVGHDNNRDGYMLNMKESQVVNAEEQTYAPAIWYSQHQSAPFPARIWVPPFADPVSSNISPYMRIWTNAIGTNIMTRMEKEGKPGAIAQARFDNWYAGFLDYIHVFRNTISFFTETAHDSASPKTYDVKNFPKNTQDLKAQIMYPHPWKGGEWHLKNSVDYMLTASMSVLETAEKYRETLLFNRYQAGRDMIAASGKDGPGVYVIPPQADMPEAASLAQLMIAQGLDVYKAPAAMTVQGKTIAAGSLVIPTDQPFAGLTRELFEKQAYPASILDGNGKPVDLPYDVTGWTLPMQMGITLERIAQPLDGAQKASLVRLDHAAAPAGSVSGKGSTYLLSRQVNNSYRALNDALAAGAKASFLTGAQDGIALTGISAAKMASIAAAYDITATATDAKTTGTPVVKGRVALYRPWGSNIDEGWTRWLLEQYKFAPTGLHNADMKGELAGHYDTIILPDIGGMGRGGPNETTPGEPAKSKYKGPLASLMDGFSDSQMPTPYAGGIGEDGAAKLKAFVEGGGTLVALNNSADAIIDLFNLPVTNVLKDLKSDQFFCSGALLQIQMAAGTSISGGMPADPIVMFERGPAFTTKPGFKGEVLATYAAEGNPLRSGVLLHPEAIAGKAAAVEVNVGKGRIYLFGFRPQWRGQSHGAYKAFFNTLYPAAKTH